MTRAEIALTIAFNPTSKKAVGEGSGKFRSKSARRFFRRWAHKAARVAARKLRKLESE